VSFEIHVSGRVKHVVEATLPTLVDALVASGITAGDPDLWGPDAAEEAARRLGWVNAVTVSRPLVPEIEALRAELVGRGITRVVLAGMGGSSLAPR
jgi:glucose-6-phosphate isomerase